MYGFGGIGRKRSKKCDREYLSKRKGVCGERSDESNADCDKQCASKRWVSVSVKTKSDIPKGKIFDVVRDLKDVVAKAPVKIGDILVKDVAETGVDIVATANVNQK